MSKMFSPSNFVTIFSLTFFISTAEVTPQPTPKYNAFLIFGDSLVDNGNNNYLFTPARADSPPYGIDYPTHMPTGRFSNGKNLPDLICEELGYESPLPYLDTELTGEKLLAGANFASAGIGILPDTGLQFINILRMQQQFEMFRAYQQRLNRLIGENEAQQLVKDAIFLISLGGNDYVNNYFLTPITARRLQYSIPEYTRYLISEYKKVLVTLYNLGARTVMVTGTGPLGCVPAELATRSTANGNCAEEPQQAATLYNPLLVQMIQELNTEIGYDAFISVNAKDMHEELVSNPESYGFSSSKVACCGQGPYNGIGLCTSASNLCSNRSEYFFWDAFHPTEAANKIIVKMIMNGSDKYMYPVNLSTIMAVRATSNF